MDLVNVTILHIGDRYASGGFELCPINADEDKARRTPKLLPGEVIKVPKDHWLASPEMSRRMMVTEIPATRPYSFYSYQEASEYRSQVTRYFRPRCTDEVIEESVESLIEELNAGKGKIVKTPAKGAKRKVTRRKIDEGNPNNSVSLAELHSGEAPIVKRRGRRGG